MTSTRHWRPTGKTTIRPVHRAPQGEKGKIMKRMYSLTLLLWSALAMGLPAPHEPMTHQEELVRHAPQGVVHDIAASQVRGIKIISSSYDSAAHAGKVMFKNVSGQDITAFHGQVAATHADGTVTIERELHAWGMLFNPLSMAKAKKYPRIAGGGQHPIRPGESHVEDFNYGWYYRPGDQITSVSVSFDLAVYSNNTVETTSDQALQRIVNDRLEMAKREAEVSLLAKDILDAQVAHPVAAFLLNLKERGFSSAATAEFELKYSSPATEAEKLAEFVDLHKETAKICEESSNLKVVSQ